MTDLIEEVKVELTCNGTTVRLVCAALGHDTTIEFDTETEALAGYNTLREQADAMNGGHCQTIQ